MAPRTEKTAADAMSDVMKSRDDTIRASMCTCHRKLVSQVLEELKAKHVLLYMLNVELRSKEYTVTNDRLVGIECTT